MKVGIEAMNVYCGTAALDVAELASHQGLNNDRFSNLMMIEKTVPMPYEDPISNGVNAAKPIIDSLSKSEKDSIDLLITCTESGIDFGKSMSTYIHDYLQLSKNCRVFELKNACYSGAAGFQMAVNYVLSQTSPGKKALVVATDISRKSAVEDSIEMSFAELSTGSGAVAMLVSDNPVVFQLDKGASGYYAYEVMDTCRPVPDQEAGDADLSLLSYLDCCENTFREYQKRVENADYKETFQYLAYHTPFAGMVKGAHRSNMRKFNKLEKDDIEADFSQRVIPSISYCQKVGNIMGATTHLALCSTIDNGEFQTPKRVGVFSYGSGCCAEFFSGVVTQDGQDRQKAFNVSKHLQERVMLTVEEYHGSFKDNDGIKFGTRNQKIDHSLFPRPFSQIEGKNRLVLSEINNYHREYRWV